MVEYQPLVRFEIVKQYFPFIRDHVENMVQCAVHLFRVAVFIVVVPENVVKTAFVMELLQQAVDFFVRDADGLDELEFQQLVAVAHLDIGEFIVVIVLQRKQVDQLVARKLVRPTVVAAVHVAEENQTVVV